MSRIISIGPRYVASAFGAETLWDDGETSWDDGATTWDDGPLGGPEGVEYARSALDGFVMSDVRFVGRDLSLRDATLFADAPQRDFWRSLTDNLLFKDQKVEEGDTLTNQDTAAHAPPTTGQYAYNTWNVNDGNFPAIGGTWVDPVFGATIRRLQNDTAGSDMYSHHWINSDSTWGFGDRGVVIDMVTGEILYSDSEVPVQGGNESADICWHPTEPHKYFRFNGAALVERDLVAQSDNTVHTFSGTLAPLGGSVNFVSADGNIFVVRPGGAGSAARVYNRSLNLLYTGNIAEGTAGDNNNWVGISPDGNYVVCQALGGSVPNILHKSFAIDHDAHTVNTTGVQFWGLCGAHADLISASDGKNYCVIYDCNYDASIYRVDITINQQGRSAAQQHADNQLLLTPEPMWAMDMHCSGGCKPGSVGQDWIFINTESTGGGDAFNGGVAGWGHYHSEILAVNILTLQIKRYTHHRSRGVLADNYNSQPRITCSWTGDRIMWTSNYNISTTNYGMLATLDTGV